MVLGLRKGQTEPIVCREKPVDLFGQMKWGNRLALVKVTKSFTDLSGARSK